MPLPRHAQPNVLHLIHCRFPHAAQLVHATAGKCISLDKPRDLWAAFRQPVPVHGKRVKIIFIERHHYRAIAAIALNKPQPIVCLRFPVPLPSFQHQHIDAALAEKNLVRSVQKLLPAKVPNMGLCPALRATQFQLLHGDARGFMFDRIRPPSLQHV